MMENSTTRTPGPAFLFMLIVLITTVIAYFVQAERKVKTEGFYPEIKAPVEGDFLFGDEEVVIEISSDPLWKSVVVFAYDEKECQVGIVKPVYDRRITIRESDLPDYRVATRGNRVTGFEIINKSRDSKQVPSFLKILKGANESSRRFGLQECLYPVCTRCMDVCPVIQHGVIEMDILENGAVVPVVHLPGCPRCGKCFEVCKVGVLLNPTKIPASVEMKPGSALKSFENREQSKAVKKE
ncbi:MAG: 4Fe-4S dicluster domain-containing protein [Desulfobacterales bacterium]|nr:4Fe-4S dicluster domain-containing protein [Desulfobacterales bacterium]